MQNVKNALKPPSIINYIPCARSQWPYDMKALNSFVCHFPNRPNGKERYIGKPSVTMVVALETFFTNPENCSSLAFASPSPYLNQSLPIPHLVFAHSFHTALIFFEIYSKCLPVDLFHEFCFLQQMKRKEKKRNKNLIPVVKVRSFLCKFPFRLNSFQG